jgi:DNA repair protein SbcC/Rad50
VRLHHLEITAFGPFADTVSVDFDRLTDAGLFLLSGATGAGKTSVLDAVCFALYGDVPGDRNAARRLRSDHAETGVAPRVALEATLSGRRFRLVRSPAWERPKKRGTGTTAQQASVTIAERVEGEWVTLSTRLDETGHLVSRLVGMNVTQFTQVAMLPQGRFQAFLRARSEERHQLLQQLFRTGRFEQVERWLRDRRLALRRGSETAHQRVADLVSRVSEATDAPLPAGWDVHELTAPAADGSLAAWAEELSGMAATRAAEADAAATVAGRTERAARESLDGARALVRARARLDAARADHDALLEQSDACAADRVALDAARRAAPVVPLHRLAATARAACDRARGRAAEASRQAAAELDLLWVDRPTLDEATAAAADGAAAVRAALPTEQRLESLGREVAADEAQREALSERLEVLAAERAGLPARLAALQAGLRTTDEAVSRIPVLESRLVEVDARRAACRQLAALSVELRLARTALEHAARDAQLKREEWLDLREARLDGMAAEIAGALAVGDSCPVCGSAEHPRKASAAPGSPDAMAEKAALKALDDAKATELLHDERLRDLTTRLAVLREQAGGDAPEALDALYEEASGELARLRQQAARRDALAADVDALTGSSQELDEECRRLQSHLSGLEARLVHRRHQADELRAVLAGLLDGSSARDLAALLAEHEARVATGRAACQALDELTAAEAAVADAEEALQEAVDEAGLGPIGAVLAASLPHRDWELLAARVADHERRLAAVAAVLHEPGAADLAGAALPDLGGLEADHGDALATLGAARAQASVWSTRAQRLAALRGELGAALDAWAPLRDELDLVTRLSTFADGRSPDNRLQMRLSAYVLAFRLSQVVAAANERLARMSDQRYSLEHTGRRGAGETRGGLSLLVRDDWSGEARDPATLSGGETFVVSLALALGLADVITQEAGGADLDTLFVDEGFGSLDADTLDDVMDTLDSLRDGGRVVGVVSHVAEMRDRIPARLQVTKSRRGSTLAVSC